jgi:hypothetical protein
MRLYYRNLVGIHPKRISRNCITTHLHHLERFILFWNMRWKKTSTYIPKASLYLKWVNSLEYDKTVVCCIGVTSPRKIPFVGLYVILYFYLLCDSEDLLQHNFPRSDSCGPIITIIRLFLFVNHANYLKIFCDMINTFLKPISNNLAQYVST